MKKYFYTSECATPGKFLVKVDTDLLTNMRTAGSWNVLAARVVGVSYPQYLRMCRDLYGAELIGKGTAYVLAYFDAEEKADKLTTYLNDRLDWILNHRQYVESNENE